MQTKRKLVKIGHTAASAGLVGGLLAYMALLSVNAPETAAGYEQLRGSIKVISDWVIFPSLAIALVSGILSMVVHTPFQDRGWVWIKAALGILMFKGVLTVVNAKASYAAAVAADITAGTAAPDALDELLQLEWGTLWVVLAITLANIVLGVWRPRIVRFGTASGTKAQPATAPANDADRAADKAA
ncbi:MAG: hypothetical protein WA989_06435 [Henriciella sp.]|uniref:DUF2269 family protein n=1 Tax=Henriciella sp. TaxID=1968823 RepID=UPI003C731881